MIDQITGIITFIDEQHIGVQTGPFVLSMQVPQPAAFAQGTTATLFIHLYWHQENGPQLFGFSHAAERAFFLKVIECSGIGPRLGLALLRAHTVAHLIEAVASNNHTLLSSISGIGKKKAEQLILHLKDKIDTLACQAVNTADAATLVEWKELQQVLESLGYGKQELVQALSFARQQCTISDPFEVRLRTALNYLSKV
jgi:Holliday junction DNA helicase RuvA